MFPGKPGIHLSEELGSIWRRAELEGKILEFEHGEAKPENLGQGSPNVSCKARHPPPQK